VIANLAAYFALHTLFADTDRVTTGPFDFEVPVVGSLQWAAVAITALACVLIFARH
jgi:chromate transporter